MVKKSKRSKNKKKPTATISQADRYFDLVGHYIFQGNYAEAVTLCERLLNYLPQHSPMRVDVLDQLGTAQGMLQNFVVAHSLAARVSDSIPASIASTADLLLAPRPWRAAIQAASL